MSDTDQRRSGYRISADAGAMDLDAIHAYLSSSYWAQGIPETAPGQSDQRLTVFRHLQ